MNNILFFRRLNYTIFPIFGNLLYPQKLIIKKNTKTMAKQLLICEFVQKIRI